MDTDGREPLTQVPRDVGFLVPEAVSLVVACLRGSEVPERDVPSLIKDIHGALLDIEREAAAADDALTSLGYSLSFQGEAPEGGEYGLPPTELEILSSLREAGIGVASIKRYGEEEILKAPEEAYTPPVSEAKVISETAPPAPEPPTALAQEVVVVPAPAPEPPAALAQEVAAVPSPAPTPARPRKPARPPAPKLPKGLKSADEALSMSLIVCLEDGKKVRNLAKHLEAKGMTVEEYRKKWSLPEAYPMMAPDTILKQGTTYEVDFATGRFREVR